MVNKGFFILGTDTGVGKTLVATSLLSGLKAKGYSTIGLKPIASGAKPTLEGLRNDDALWLQKTASISLPYEQVNPFCFAEPIAPHIAAAQINCRLTVSEMMEACQFSLNHPADYHIIEGAGGICVPLNKNELLVDLALAMSFPIILVVGLRLGCLNQALLNWNYLQQRNLPVAGWLANQVDPDMACVEENVKFLEVTLPIPCLGFFPYQQINLSDLSSLIDYNRLVGTS